MDNKILQIKNMHRKLTEEIQIFNNDDFKNFYRQIKSLSLLNQLYDSDSITHDEYQKEEKQILGRFKRLKSHLEQHDLVAFARLYNIEKEYKRILNHIGSGNNSEKELMSVCLTLGSKFPEIIDTIHTSRESREVRNLINLLSEITLLLNKYKKLVRKQNLELNQSIEKFQRIYEQSKKKNVNDQFTAMEYYELEDAVQKLLMEFQSFR